MSDQIKSADALRPTGAEFTPGPWEADIEERDERFDVKDSTGGLVASCLDGHYDEFGFVVADTCAPNARLIAAAPDLYAAAQLAVRKIRPLADQGEDAIWRPAVAALDALTAALRQAEGR